MNNFGAYITAEEAYKLNHQIPLKEWQRRAKSKAECDVCGQPAWKLTGCGLCFTCTTGESDASKDYELKED